MLTMTMFEAKLHPERKMNVWTKLHGNLYSSCWDISQKTANVNLIVTLEEELGVRRSPKPFMTHHHTSVDSAVDPKTPPGLFSHQTLPWLQPQAPLNHLFPLSLYWGKYLSSFHPQEITYWLTGSFKLYISMFEWSFSPSRTCDTSSCHMAK